MSGMTRHLIERARRAEANRPRIGDWIATAGGHAIWPLDMRVGDPITIQDIAHQLAQHNRWCGAARLPFSVAAHSMLVSRVVSKMRPDLALAGLIHDAYEAYTWDAPAPIKCGLRWAVEGGELTYVQAEKAGLAAIFGTLGVSLPSIAGHTVVADADRFLAAVEWRWLMSSNRPARLDSVKIDVKDLNDMLGQVATLASMRWWEVRDAFVAEFDRLRLRLQQ